MIRKKKKKEGRESREEAELAEQRRSTTGRKNGSCKSHQIEGMVNEFPCRRLRDTSEKQLRN